MVAGVINGQAGNGSCYLCQMWAEGKHVVNRSSSGGSAASVGGGCAE